LRRAETHPVNRLQITGIGTLQVDRHWFPVESGWPSADYIGTR
jgi:hypothetical protein